MNESRVEIVRSFNAELTEAEGDGRTILGRCVPYGEVADVEDEHGPYREMFARGAFRRANKSPQHVLLDFEHQTDPLSVLGHGVEFIERDDGLYGTFRAINGPVGDQGLEMVRAGMLTGLSVRALVLGPGRKDGDVVVRTACHLDRVALCRQPAYAGAVVEALRSRGDRIGEPAELAQLRPARDTALDDRLRALRATGVLASAT
jgi:hypothetical protein